MQFIDVPLIDIKDYRIILMDATVASGAAAMMAIRVLLDHEVPEENISLVSMLMAVSGVHTIAYAFPKVKIVTTAVDAEINEKFYANEFPELVASLRSCYNLSSFALQIQQGCQEDYIPNKGRRIALPQN